jgi:signal transduction histidine kinase/ActR/RegA family two-component response regulator
MISCQGTYIETIRESASRRSRSGALVLLLATIAIALLLASPASAEPGRVVRVGVYENKPKVFTNEAGRASGLFIEFLAEIAKQEGWTLSFVPCAWAQCLRALEDGQIDLMPDVAHSWERDQRYDFNRTFVIESWSQLYATSDASIQSLGDVDGKRVALLGDSIQRASFEEMVAGFGWDVTIVPTESLDDAFRAVGAGNADAAIANHFFGDYYHVEYGLVRTPIVFQAAQLHYATSKGRNPELLRAIDRHLDSWRREPNSVYYTILSRWMDRPPTTIMPRRVLWVIGTTVGMLLLAAGMIFGLRRQVRSRTQHLEKANEDLRKAEAALRKSEEVLNSSQRLARVGGWEWDLEQQSATLTKEALRILGLSPDLVLDSQEHMDRIIDGFEPDAQPSVREAIDRCCGQGTPFDLEAPFGNTAERLWVRITSEAVLDAQGNVSKIVGNIMDVTERRAAAQQRRDIEEQLRQSQKLEAIGKLAGGVAHDFNNLLTVILGYSQLAVRQVKAGDIASKQLAEVVNAAQRAAVLTRQLLAFSRNQVLELKAVHLNQIVNDLEQMLRRIIGEDVELALVLAPELGMTQADASQLEQVLMNLVVNARDAMPGGGKLTIETANADFNEEFAAKHVDLRPGPYVLLSVSDSGCGMDPGTRSRIFEPFFTTKERGKGTGLGLATVYGIVNQCGGHIWVDSEPGRGTTFKIALPRETSAVPLPPAATTTNDASRGTETLLLVEDDEGVRELAKEILQTAGYRVLVAATAEDGLRISGEYEGKIHLLLTDVIMPGMSGDAMAECLRSDRPEMNVLFMSGYFDGEIAPGGILGAGMRFLGKPITIESLTRKVRETIDDG